MPPEEISNKSRLGFQLEKAFWFYDDFSRPEQPSLPKLTLKTFAQRLLQRCPRDLLLPALGQSPNYARFVAEFYQYKSMVPTCGAIILNEDLTKCLMVRGWSSKSTWGFPKGKINKDEPPSHCAVREVFEETGFDIAPHLKEDAFIQIEQQTGANANNNGAVGRNPIRLYIISGIPEATTYFAPQTRREIGDIAWHPIRDLRYDRQASSIRYFNVMPFVGPLKAWIRKQQTPQSTQSYQYSQYPQYPQYSKSQATTIINAKPQKDRKKTRASMDELDEPLEAPGPTQVHPNDVDPLYLQLTERINKLMLPLSTFSVNVSSLVNTLNSHFPEI